MIEVVVGAHRSDLRVRRGAVVRTSSTHEVCMKVRTNEVSVTTTGSCSCETIIAVRQMALCI
jgi:hypothetical protein